MHPSVSNVVAALRQRGAVGDADGHRVRLAAAGHGHAVFLTTYDELLRLTVRTPAQVAG